MCVDCLMNTLAMLRASCGCFYGVHVDMTARQRHQDHIRRDQLSPDELALTEKFWTTYKDLAMGMAFHISREICMPTTYFVDLKMHPVYATRAIATLRNFSDTLVDTPPHDSKLHLSILEPYDICNPFMRREVATDYATWRDRCGPGCKLDEEIETEYRYPFEECARRLESCIGDVDISDAACASLKMVLKSREFGEIEPIMHRYAYNRMIKTVFETCRDLYPEWRLDHVANNILVIRDGDDTQIIHGLSFNYYAIPLKRDCSEFADLKARVRLRKQRCRLMLALGAHPRVGQESSIRRALCRHVHGAALVQLLPGILEFAGIVPVGEKKASVLKQKRTHAQL